MKTSAIGGVGHCRAASCLSSLLRAMTSIVTASRLFECFISILDFCEPSRDSGRSELLRGSVYELVVPGRSA